ncbi:pilus assembly protein CpaD [Caulobacter sp. Root487D2Y]|uniref:CpaD family pilus assembly protein n=1 Tax=Caulobacter sp. Root487D2Y TaxID=1736547 RepID=UPI0006FD72A9|nr:CpaD family pilus assembly lipoprotein [Caulobacter sp. Root487D2Y]KQY35569.1 pilus assembly protein CpaD [Caulobacter sp. Root487D2Y]
MTRPHPSSPRTAAPLVSKLAAAGLVLTLLAACAAPAAGPETAVAPRTPSEQWNDRVYVDSHPDEVLLALHAEGLSVAQSQALDGLLDRWMAAEAREIVVSAPTGGASGEVAGRMAVAARQRLIAMGAPAAKVRVMGYDAAGAPAAPLKVGFLRYTAQVPRCGGWENITGTRNNTAYENFGCAVTANIAAQVANPEDLLSPRPEGPIDSGRRATVLDKYRKGETTSSAKDEQSNGVVSKAVH